MERKKQCLCGCGGFVKKGNKFLPGHNFKMKNNTSPESEKIRIEKISAFQKSFHQNPEVRDHFYKTVWIGRPHTKESKQKMSIAGKIREAKKKENGYVVSEETRQKISKSNKGRICSEETKKKISKVLKGKSYLNPEQRHRISNTLKEYYKTHDNPFKDKHHSEEAKEKNRIAHKGIFIGDKASNWQGGKDSFPYAIEWTPWLREEIKIRDNYTCQNPNCTNEFPVLDVHHIDYKKDNNDPSNLITLCKRCHGKTQKHRQKWITYYTEIMKIKLKPKIKRITR
jgi:hypothetical protein